MTLIPVSAAGLVTETWPEHPPGQKARVIPAGTHHLRVCAGGIPEAYRLAQAGKRLAGAQICRARLRDWAWSHIRRLRVPLRHRPSQGNRLPSPSPQPPRRESHRRRPPRRRGIGSGHDRRHR